MKRIYYFAYGSNLLQDRLDYRLGRIIRVVGNYTLPNYKLSFTARSFGKAAFANIEPSAGDSVEGTLYEISSEELMILSRYEALYDVQFFTVPQYPDAVCCVYIYKFPISKVVCKPSLDYINIIIDGCLEKGLHRTYNSLIDYKLKVLKAKGSKHKKVVIDG